MDPKPVDLSYDDFAKLDIRAGRVLSVEAVPKSKKLLKLQVFFGPVIGTRTILAGIAQAKTCWSGRSCRSQSGTQVYGRRTISWYDLGASSVGWRSLLG